MHETSSPLRRANAPSTPCVFPNRIAKLKGEIPELDQGRIVLAQDIAWVDDPVR